MSSISCSRSVTISAVRDSRSCCLSRWWLLLEFTKVFMGIDWPAFIMAVRGSPGGSSIEVHTASQNARQEGYGGSGAISDGRVVVRTCPHWTPRGKGAQKSGGLCLDPSGLGLIQSASGQPTSAAEEVPRWPQNGCSGSKTSSAPNLGAPVFWGNLRPSSFSSSFPSSFLVRFRLLFAILRKNRTSSS